MKKQKQPPKVTLHYRGFTIDVWRDECLGGWSMIYYSIVRDKDGWELDCGFYDSEDPLMEFAEDCKHSIDDYFENPEDYDE